MNKPKTAKTNKYTFCYQLFLYNEQKHKKYPKDLTLDRMKLNMTKLIIRNFIRNLSEFKLETLKDYNKSREYQFKLERSYEKKKLRKTKEYSESNDLINEAVERLKISS